MERGGCVGDTLLQCVRGLATLAKIGIRAFIDRTYHDRVGGRNRSGPLLAEKTSLHLLGMITMATKKTSMFTLTERLTMTSTATTFATIDLGSYVDVGDRQALQIHSVDFIFQGATANGSPTASLGATGNVFVQVTDLNRGGLVFADDRALVASANLTYDTDGILSEAADMFPDNYGKGADDGRFVVNDQLYIAGRANPLAADLNVTIRVNASIVTLSQKDFMSIAIQSTAADN